jgi:hypothetical protein
MSSSPDWVVCLNCESPCYVFEWEEGEVSEALCQVCGNDQPEEFVTPEEFDALSQE